MGRSKKQTSRKVSNYRLIINSFAELDLQIAKEWYDIQKEGPGSEFIYEIDNTLKRISNNPNQFPKIKSIQKSNCQGIAIILTIACSNRANNNQNQPGHSKTNKHDDTDSNKN